MQSPPISVKISHSVLNAPSPWLPRLELSYRHHLILVLTNLSPYGAFAPSFRPVVPDSLPAANSFKTLAHIHSRQTAADKANFPHGPDQTSFRPPH